MKDKEFFETNRDRRYRWRSATASDGMGTDPYQGVLVSRLAPDSFLKLVTPHDIDDYPDDDKTLEELAQSTPFMFDRKKRKHLSFADSCKECRKRLVKSATRKKK